MLNHQDKPNIFDTFLVFLLFETHVRECSVEGHVEVLLLPHGEAGRVQNVRPLR